MPQHKVHCYNIDASHVTFKGNSMLDLMTCLGHVLISLILILQCLNRDGVTINLDVSYQFKASAAHLYDLVIQFKDFDSYQKVLGAAG